MLNKLKTWLFTPQHEHNHKAVAVENINIYSPGTFKETAYPCHRLTKVLMRCNCGDAVVKEYSGTWKLEHFQDPADDPLNSAVEKILNS